MDSDREFFGRSSYGEFYGRRRIVTDAEEITRDNVVDELKSALEIHQINAQEIDYLYNYYKGRHPAILNRRKQFNEHVCNKITVNRAAEIIDFKTGFLLSEPVQFIGRDDKADTDKINALNDFFYQTGKQQQDMELVDWLHICGIGNRIILPQKPGVDGVPFRTYVLDPRFSFVVTRSDLDKRRMFGVKYVIKGDVTENPTTNEQNTIYSVWTENAYYEIQGDVIIKEEDRYYGAVPIIEYEANLAREGAFENVLPLLDAIDSVESDRADSVDNFVQALLLFKNCDIDDEQFQRLKELGGLKVPEGGDVSYLVQELNQSQTQEFIDDMYDAVLTICGIPGRNGANGASTSDTGAATLLRNGWQSAVTYASKTVSYFIKSEKEMLKLALLFAGGLNLQLPSLDIKFPLKNYQNSYEQAQILDLMLRDTGMKIHPQLAFTSSSIWADGMQAYEMSRQFTEELEQKQKENQLTAMTESTDETEFSVNPADGTDNQRNNQPGELG